MNFRVVLVLWLLKYSSAQDANCDFHQDVSVGRTYYISSPNYPNNYQPGVNCRWTATCPAGYNCRLDCPENKLPQSQGCTVDRLLVSRSGDPQLNSAETYCGTESLTAVSTAQTITLGLISNRTSPAGRFECSLVAQAAQPQPPCSCGIRRQNRIVGGVETGINEFTMLAAVVDVRIQRIKCGAVIISSKYVLTAAHCVFNQSVKYYAVVVGEHDVSAVDTDVLAAYPIDRFIIHPLFSRTTYDNDIAIVSVATLIVFNERVGPVCLPFSQVNNDFAGSKVTIVGWGTTFAGGPNSDVPLKADLDVLSQSTCRSRGAPVTDRQMCTYTPGKDACQDDTGGPVLWTNRNNSLLYSVGIISYGESCASDIPGINTRVTSFLDWIVQNVPENFCTK